MSSVSVLREKGKVTAHSGKNKARKGKKVNVNFALEQATEAQRGSRVIAMLFL